MYKKEQKQVVKFEQVITHAVCDCCGKEVKAKQMPDEWHKISAHHNDWGNDSCDSYEEYMVCSPECYKKQLKSVVEDFKEHGTAEIDEMSIEFAVSLVAFLYAT